MPSAKILLLALHLHVKHFIVLTKNTIELKYQYQKKIQGYSSTMRFYAKSEGFIKKISGIKMISKLPSFINLDKKLGKGDKCLHAKNGGVYVFKVNLFNTDKDQLTADKRTITKTVHIETVKQRKSI